MCLETDFKKKLIRGQNIFLKIKTHQESADGAVKI